MASIYDCTICYENFKNPRMLPCGHSFCEKCLEWWQNTSTSKTSVQATPGKPSYMYMGQQARTPYKLSCLECQEKHPVPPEGVKGFPKNFTLARAADDTPECQNCCTGIDAVAKCLECNGCLCGKCRDLHRKGLTRNHTIISILEAHTPEQSKLPTTVPQYKPCSYHDNKAMEYYCIKCKVACCQAGSLTQHKHHDCVTLNERITKISQNIDDIMKAYMQVVLLPDQVDESLDKVNKLKRTNTVEITNNISYIKKCLIQAVEICASKLLDEVKQDDVEFSESIGNAKKEISTIKRRVISVQSDVEGWLKRRIPHEIYSQEEEMKQKLVPSEVIQAIPRPMWSMLTLERDEVEIHTEISRLFGTLKKTVKHDKPTLIRTICVRTAEDKNLCLLVDAAIMSNGNVAVTDFPHKGVGNAKVKVFSSEGELVHQSQEGLFTRPRFITPMPGDANHLLVNDGHKLLMWDIMKHEAKLFVTFNRETLTDPWGLSTIPSGSQNIVLIADRMARAVIHVDVDGWVVKQDLLSDEVGKNMRYVAGHTNSHQIIVSSYDKGVCAVINSRTQWSVDNKRIPDPAGVVLTGTGEVLVADQDSHRVLLVSRDGLQVDTLLSAADGLSYPSALAYSEQLHLLVVVELGSQLLKLYHF